MISPQGSSSAYCDTGGTRSSWDSLSGDETLILLPFSALSPIFLDHITDPACLTTCSVTAHHGDGSVLFHKANRGTDGWGLPTGQGQLSQLPSPVCVPPADTCSVNFNWGRGAGRPYSNNDQTECLANCLSSILL